VKMMMDVTLSIIIEGGSGRKRRRGEGAREGSEYWPSFFDTCLIAVFVIAPVS
jgi:hypothetical protein